MAEYKGIKGFKVQYLSADPSNPIIGQTWYNDTSKHLKFTSATTAGAWATGGSLNTARGIASGSCGIQTAALAFGSPSATEEYDGTSWTTSPASLATGRQQLGSAGTQPAALAIGGYTTAATAATEEWTGAGAAVTKTITVS